MGITRGKKFCSDSKYFLFVFDQNKSIFLKQTKKIKIPSHLVIPITMTKIDNNVFKTALMRFKL